MRKDEPFCSWFDKYILSEALILRQAQDERRVEGLTTSGDVSKCRNAPHYCVFDNACSGARTPDDGRKGRGSKPFARDFGVPPDDAQDNFTDPESLIMK